MRPKTLLVTAISVVWLLALLYAFWWYQGRYLRAFDEQAVLFSGDQLQLPPALAGPGPVRLVHFWDPACPCNVGNQQHLTELLQRFAERGVSFHVLRKAASKGSLPAPLAALQPIAELPGAAAVPSSPAVAIWDREGRLAYFGPYSEGAVCTSENSFVEPILEAVLAGRRVEATHGLAVGCFCDWATTGP